MMLSVSKKMVLPIVAMLLGFVGLSLFWLADGAFIYAMPFYAAGACLLSVMSCGASVQFVRISKRGVQTDAG